jgi:hypothetical protein
MTDPDHPILEKPWTCEIAQFEWSAGSDDVPSVLDVTFVRDGSSRRLRFIDPQDVTLEFSGRFPIQCGEMAILDVRVPAGAMLEIVTGASVAVRAG